MSDKPWLYNYISNVSVSVDTEKLRAYSKQLGGVCQNSEKIAARIAKICKNFDAVNAIRTVNNGASIVKKCKQYLDFTASAFEDTENYLMKQDPTNPWSGLTRMWDPSSKEVLELAKIRIPEEKKTIVKGSSEFYSTFKGVSRGHATASYKVDENGETTRIKWRTDKKWGEFHKGQEPKDGIERLLENSGEKEKKKTGVDKDVVFFDKSKTWIDKSRALLGENSEHFDLEAFKRELHTSASGGHSTKKGWYVEAEAGASFSLLAGTLKGSLGNEVLGLNGSVNAGVGTVSGSLGFSASTKEGVGLNASFEADLVKVGLTGGFTVLGVDAEASANVKVGFGAHAKVGYKKGVVTCDIGAAFGLGFDLKFKVDVKKPVKAVKKAAKAAWRKIKSWF